MISSFYMILLAVLAYGLIHSFLASHTLKARFRQWFGPSTDRWYRLFFNFVAIITLLPVLVMPLLLPDKKIYTIAFPWIIITLTFQLVAIVILLVGLHQTGIAPFLGLQQAFIPEATTPPHLVTDGLYHYVRHPLYISGLIIIWLIPVLTWNLLALILGLTLYIF